MPGLQAIKKIGEIAVTIDKSEPEWVFGRWPISSCLPSADQSFPPS